MNSREKFARLLFPFNDDYGMKDCRDIADTIMDMVNDKYGHLLENKMSDEIKIESGARRKFSTGAESQASEGKGTPVLVPGDAIIDIAKLFEKGAAVYGARNWEKGIPLSEILNSLERHLQAEKMGRTDENHARALAWRAVIYLATKLRVAKGLLPVSLDDIPDYESIADAAVIEESISW